MAQVNRDPNAKSLPRFQFKNMVVVTGAGLMTGFLWLVAGCWPLDGLPRVYTGTVSFKRRIHFHI